MLLKLATCVHMLFYVSEHGSGVNATSAAFAALPKTDKVVLNGASTDVNTSPATLSFSVVRLHIGVVGASNTN